MGVTHSLNEPYYSGGSASASDVPRVFPVALNGRPYLVDLKSRLFRRQTIPLLRQQADTAATPGETSISPEDLWRRAAEDWSHGAGQDFLDRPESDPKRFNTSKGIFVWEPWEISLLPDTDQKRVSTETNLHLAVAGDFLYVSDGDDVLHTQDITVDSPTFTSATIQAGEGAQSVQSITSDGFTVYAGLGTNGIHTSERGATTASHYSDLQAQLVGYVKGRLMAAKDNVIYNVTASGAAPSALLTHPNTDFTWVGFAEGPGHIFAAGFSGDKSTIYKTAIKADGTALDVPTVAGELPDGEIIRSIQGYLGFIMLGTDKGVRFAGLDDNGNLLIGAIIETDSAVRAFEGQERFVWFAWSDFDGTSTGLGRMDLTVFTSPLTPGYASDLMATAQGNVLSIATFQDKRVFTVSASGVWAEESTKVSEGTIDSGLITYGLPDIKIALFLDLVHGAPLDGKITSFVSTGGAFTDIGNSDVPHDIGTAHSLPVGQIRGDRFEIREKLEAQGTDGPTLLRHTLRGTPAPSRGEILIVPVLLYEQLEAAGAEYEIDVTEELDEIRELTDHRTLVSFQMANEGMTVFLEEYEFAPEKPTTDKLGWQGTCILRLKRPSA